MNKEFYDKVCLRCSRITARNYSTSFSLGIRCLEKEFRDPIYSIYGFVRFADEIVDSFYEYDKATLLERFKQDTYLAIDEKISLNPILNSFQKTVSKYGIEKQLYDQFLKSMEMDLNLINHDSEGIKEYILGSAEVVGLMSLRVFCKNDKAMYEKLKPSAMRLGAAFQKVNFLRDINVDLNQLGRNYFPQVDFTHFDEPTKKRIEEDIAKDFKAAYEGLKQLPRSTRFGVYVAYVYYLALFKKIKNTPFSTMLTKRIRVQNHRKFSILAYSFVKHQLNLI